MELELSLKITKVRDDDDLVSVADFRFAKDSAGPLFFSTENDTKFILTANLKGFRREKIKIEINEDGTRITIKGEKQVEEMMMVGWTIVKKGAEIRPFKRVFRIPDGVILDRIKAKFDEDESTLAINMPKSIKGLLGVEIEEVNEEELEIPQQDSTIRMTYKQKESKEEKVEAFKIDQGKEEMEEMEEMEEISSETEVERDLETLIDERMEIGAERAGGQSEKTDQPVLSPEQVRVERLPDLTENVKKEEISDTESERPEEKGSEEQHRSPDKEIQQSESPNKTSIQQSKVEEEQSTEGEIHRKETEMPPQEHQKEVEQPTETTEPPPIHKPSVEELPAGSKEEIPETESKKPKGESEETAGDKMNNRQSELPNETSSTQQSKVEEEGNKVGSPQEESKMPQEESSKNQTNLNIQEPKKSESDQELEQTTTPHLDNAAAQERGIEVTSQEAENETGEATADQVKLAKEKEVHEQESLKVEKRKRPSDQAAIQPKQPRSKLFFAGSAFLVSIIVLVIHLIRGKKG